MIVWRLIHIFSGVFWVGATYMMLGFVEPSVKATGEVGKKFMQQIGLKSKFSPIMGLMGILSSVSGLIMYDKISGFRGAWISSATGLSLTLGGLFGLLALVFGFVIQFRTSGRMKALAGDMAAAGGPPSPEQMAEMGRLSERMSLGGRISAVLMTLSLAGMSVAQYVG
jgi:uncharacterized membrane protein